MWHHWLARPLLLSALAAVPLLGMLSLWERRRRNQDLARLGNPGTLPAQISGGGWGRLRSFCLLCAMLLLGAGMAGPQWGRDWEQALAPGRDVVVILDCSRSMLAETPSRLERARQALLDLAAGLEKRGGHRVGLVLCAGRARLACPLTHDYYHFRDVIRHLDPAALEAQLAPPPHEKSGTRLGAGIRAALVAQDSRFGGAQDILLLSDGDDPAKDGEWRDSAAAAASQGVAVHTIGIGDPDTPSTIPGEEGSLRYQGQEVQTQLEEETLREISRLAHGMYVPAHTRTLHLGEFYLGTIPALPTRDATDDSLPIYHPRWTWFLAPALGLLALAVGWPAGLRLRWWRSRRLAPAAVLVAVLLVAAAPTRDPDALLRQGNTAFARGDFAAAAELYEQAQLTSTDPALVAFNLAAARYHLAAQTEGPSADLQEAEQMYRCCLDPADPRRPRALYALGNCLLRKGAGHDRAALEAAIACYDQVLHTSDLDEELAADARHNRARALLLALQTPPAPPESQQERPHGDDPNHPPPSDMQPPMTDTTPDAGPDGSAAPRPGSAQVKPEPGQTARPTDEPPQPGQGQLQPIPDTVDAPPLSGEEAARHLEQAAQRIAVEQRQHQRSLARPLLAGVRDW
jgi:Ca-activated chloride channel family protein